MPIKLADYPWWKKTVVYQIYPRSFMDSNGDGIGDIPGIISKLDYLKELGIETIWFSPFYSSPQIDHGYDISDFRGIAPEYGTLADCDRLIAEMHARGLKIVLDITLNHTSDQHPWFLESRSSRDNPKRDWYIWRDGRKPKGKKPPNNWISNTIGSAWHYDPTTDQWFYGMFLGVQPDLNWRNPEVKQEMFDTLRFWLKKGVDGFRLDMISSIYEEEDTTKNHSLFHPFQYNLDHRDTLQFTKELHAVMDEFSDPERFLVGEVAGSLPLIKKYYGDPVPPAHTNGLHLAFHFQGIRVGFGAGTFRKLFRRMDEVFAEPFIPTLLSTNHDRMRRISRLGNDVRKAKVNVTFQLTGRGVPFLYYGEEIGMANDKIPLKKAQDPIAKKFKWVPQWAVNTIAKKLIKETLNRDEVRTPMQWEASPNAGFAREGVKTWLPATTGKFGYDKINVAAQQEAPESLLKCYQRLLRLRAETPALHAGSFAMISTKGIPKTVFAYERRGEMGGKPQVLHMYLNFDKKTLKFPSVADVGKVLFSTHLHTNPVEGTSITLAPYEAIICQIQ